MLRDTKLKCTSETADSWVETKEQRRGEIGQVMALLGSEGSL